MSDAFSPDKMALRKSGVLKGARERIIDTDERLDRQKDRTRRAEGQARAEREQREAALAFLNHPAGKTYLDSMYRQMGAAMADETLKELRENGVFDAVKNEYQKALIYEIAYAAGERIARTLANALGQTMEVRTQVNRMPYYEAVEAITQIDVPPTRVRFAHRRELRPY